MKVTATNVPLQVRVRQKGEQYNENRGEAYDGTGKGPYDTHNLEVGQSIELDGWAWLEVVELTGTPEQGGDDSVGSGQDL